MAIVNEVYRIIAGEGSSKDVSVTTGSGDSSVIEFVVEEVDNVPGVNVGDNDSVDLATVEHVKLYDADGTVSA
jgi:hypothetical protein